MRPATAVLPFLALLAAAVARAGEAATPPAPVERPSTAGSPSDTTGSPAATAAVEGPPGTGAPAESGTPPQEEAKGTIRGRNLWETFSHGGPLMYPILLCSLIAVAFVIERVVALRRGIVAPRGLAESVLEAVHREGAVAGISLCRERPSALARVLEAGLALANQPREVMAAAVEETGERELWSLERFAKPLSIIAGVAPLLGLLGTVWGMIMAFDVVAAKGAVGDPRQLAEGIGTALLTTFAGLSVAIPSYVLYHYFRSKSDHLVVEIEETASHLIAQLTGTAADAHPPTHGGGRGPAADAAH